jgi:hypothetical protein
LSEKIPTELVLKALRLKHEREKWLFVSELRVGTGWAHGNDQRIDAWSIRIHPSKGYARRSFEIKVSRQDFLHEIKHSHKRSRAVLMCNEFYFVAPLGMIKEEEVPHDAGLMECYQKDLFGNFELKVTVPSPWLDTGPPNWDFVASLLRRVRDDGTVKLTDWL